MVGMREGEIKVFQLAPSDFHAAQIDQDIKARLIVEV
jgi:hypothetical protein